MTALKSIKHRQDDAVLTRFVEHPTFRDKNACRLYGPDAASCEPGSMLTSHLPDDLTRELAKRMHYAAYRSGEACDTPRARTWRNRYVELRNQIILGNRKLIFRAVHTRVRDSQLAEECASECHIVMIRAVSAYNPWLGIRFSTYAFTCLLRELTRIVHRANNDRLRQAASFDDAIFDEAAEPEVNQIDPDNLAANIRQFLANEHPLLSDREKHVLCQRFGFTPDGSTSKLKDIGIRLDLSKERVRQLQISGIEKLRDIFNDGNLGA